MTTTEKIEQVKMTDCEYCYATDKTMIDVLHPVTGLTVCYGKTLEQVRAERPEYANAERMTVDEFCRRKAAAQDAATATGQWDEITEEQYWYWLEVVPPALMENGGFLVGEASDHHAGTGRPRYQACRERAGKFYAYTVPLTVEQFRTLTK
jgi:hypothetical protein